MPNTSSSFMEALITILKEHVLQQTPLPISWSCFYCGEQHSGNLFKKVRFVDTSINGDPNFVELKDEQGSTFAVINISKNKKPNIDSVKSFRRQGIIYLQVCPPIDGDKSLLECIGQPRFVSTCFNPKCKKCGGFQHKKSMVIIDSQCWKCKGEMKIAMLDCSGYHLGPERFTADELGFARSKGVLIINSYSKTVGESYLSNTCPACGALTGQHYLFKDHFTEAVNGWYKYQSYPAGYSCEYCYMGYEPDESDA